MAVSVDRPSERRAARARDVVRTLALVARLRAHDRWSAAALREHQERLRRAAIAHALTSSPFYRELYIAAGAGPGSPAAQLPVVTKDLLMEHFDDVVTDRRLCLAGLEEHLVAVSGDALYLGEYRVMSTGGTSGVRGIFPYSRREWATSLASTIRTDPFMGLRPYPGMRTATIGATSPQHWGGRFGATVGLGIARTLALDVRAPVAQLVAALNRHRPVHLGLYPSIATTLAGEQLEGRLRIAPRAVSTSGEMLTPEVRERIRAAWGVEPYDGYATTETGFCGLECTEHDGIHLLEDLTLFEVVDDAGEPAAPGTPGARVLVTNLFARTLPVIRYELSDMLTLARASCPCGRPFRLVERIAGRSEDVLVLPGRGAESVRVHPTVLTGALERVPGVRAFQIVRETGRVRVRIVVAPGAMAADVRAVATLRLETALEGAGAAPAVVRIEPVEALERTGVAGKLRVVIEPAAPESAERDGS